MEANIEVSLLLVPLAIAAIIIGYLLGKHSK